MHQKLYADASHPSMCWIWFQWATPVDVAGAPTPWRAAAMLHLLRILDTSLVFLGF